MTKEINLDKMSIVEIKALCFDLEQEIRQIEEKYKVVAQALQKRLNEEDVKKMDDVK